MFHTLYSMYVPAKQQPGPHRQALPAPLRDRVALRIGACTSAWEADNSSTSGTSPGAHRHGGMEQERGGPVTKD